MNSLFTAKNMQNLFFKCLLVSILCNLLFYFVYHSISIHIADPFMFDFTLGLVQVFAGIVLGFFMRRQNTSVFQNSQNRKLFIGIVLLIDLFGLVCFVITDLIVMPYTALIMFFYNTFHIERIFTLWDFYSCLCCLSVAFLFQNKKQKTAYNS